ncbi:MAG: amidohydrolase family protein [Microthrixaceae bacterium]|nr:amidohydrolase family protein [Microthrixaceae bacterium]
MSDDVIDVEAAPTVLIRNGRVFDGAGSPSVEADVLVRDGVVAAIGLGLVAPAAATVVDADGCWVTPGFIDLHTHYDAELEIAPSLGESVRHGVTTVLIGSCGLSFVMGEPEDLADQFCRVEGVPRDVVLPLLETTKNWDDPSGYLAHLRSLPLGPNVTLFLGHSAVRTSVMGLERAVDASAKPTRSERREMLRLLDEALDAGYLGMSFNTLPWDKLGGDRFNSRPTPSVFATFGEYRSFAKVLRERGRIFQVVPDLQGRWNIPVLMAMSAGVGRPALRMNLLSMLDPVVAHGSHRFIGATTNAFNRVLRGDVRFQAVPLVFDLFVDGLDVPVMEEFGAGTQALAVGDLEARRRLMSDPDFRARFRKQWNNQLAPRAYHRKLDEPVIVGCPDETLVGKTFGEVAAKRGVDAIEAFMDLQAQFGHELRWRTVVANDRPRSVAQIANHPAAIMGFADSGAHLRNMAFYDLPLHLLRLAASADGGGGDDEPVLSPERAVYRMTGEIADYLGIDAGRLVVGGRADIAVVDPATLDERLDNIVEDDSADVVGVDRLVRRHDECVTHVLVNGRLAWSDGAFVEGFGAQGGYGRVLTRVD